jgi:hypothetical protein
MDEITAAAAKEHQRNYQKLHVDRDGTVSWFESINRTDDLIDRNAPGFAAIASVITVGTGSVACNCDFCDDEAFANRDEAIDACIGEHGTQHIEDRMLEAFAQIPVGYFDDEAAI